jgi:hypothetical protein
MEHLCPRGLGGKRSLALGEFSLEIEAYEHFVRKESLRLVHECVFGVVALEVQLLTHHCNFRSIMDAYRQFVDAAEKKEVTLSFARIFSYQAVRILNSE